MTRLSTVSVVVPTRNRLHLLPKALDSVMAQARPHIRVQLIVPDNGCDEAAEAIVRRYGGEYVEARVEGPSAVRNLGLSRVRGDYVTFLDDDDVWTPDHLEAHLRVLERDPALAATVSKQVVGDADAREVGNVAGPAHRPRGTDLFATFLSYFPQVGTIVVRAEVMREFGGFDERLIHGEDWDWFLRISQRYPIGFVDRTTYVVRTRRWTPGETRIAWTRLGYWHRVFWKHVLHAGARRPPALQVLDVYRRHTGLFATWLCSCAVLSFQSGRRWRAGVALAQAFVASPPHATAWLVRRAFGRQPAWGSAET
jgi:glycosyltransferase involved in cell wall biosynthesis